jgi:hypothetical protein
VREKKTAYVSVRGADNTKNQDEQVNGVLDFDIHASGALVLELERGNVLAYAAGEWLMFTTTENEG